jgi:hypothetical protein
MLDKALMKKRLRRVLQESARSHYVNVHRQLLNLLLADLLTVTLGRRYSAPAVEEIFALYSEYSKAKNDADAEMLGFKRIGNRELQ